MKKIVEFSLYENEITNTLKMTYPFADYGEKIISSILDNKGIEKDWHMELFEILRKETINNEHCYKDEEELSPNVFITYIWNSVLSCDQVEYKKRLINILHKNKNIKEKSILHMLVVFLYYIYEAGDAYDGHLDEADQEYLKDLYEIVDTRNLRLRFILYAIAKEHGRYLEFNFVKDIVKMV